MRCDSTRLGCRYLVAGLGGSGGLGLGCGHKDSDDSNLVERRRARGYKRRSHDGQRCAVVACRMKKITRSAD